jgi:hypothetical protein
MTKEELVIENARLIGERDGYRNGQEQMQRIISDLYETINKYAVERFINLAEIAELRAEIRKMNHPPWGIREVGEEG